MGQPAESLVNGDVRLKRWRRDDARVVYQVVMESLEHLRPWIPWVRGYGHDEAVAYAEQCEQDWQSGAAYNYAILASDREVVGSCALMRRIGPGGLQVGCWLHPEYTGRGLATMAVQALVEQAFALPDVDRVEAIHDAANKAAGGIPRRLGFTEVERRAVPREPGRPGEVGVSVVWRITRAEWRR
jgi:ribosomal-protein-serine acetyltransferase